MDEKQEQPKEAKKPSLLWPMLLWPLVGVPVYWVLFPLYLRLAIKELPPPHQVSVSIGASLEALTVACGLCFLIGAVIGFRFTRRTTSIRFPLAEPIACGFGAAVLCLVYNFGGCMAVGISSSNFR